MRSSIGKLAVLCGLLLGCSGQGSKTEVVILVYSDLNVGAEVDNVQVEVAGGSKEPQALSFPLSGRPWPVQFSLVFPGNQEAAFHITATGRQGTVPVVVQEASSSCVPNQRKVLVLTLYRSCAPVVQCGQGMTCRSGNCQSTAVAPQTLPDYDPSHLPAVPDAGTKPDAMEYSPVTDAGIDGGADRIDSVLDAKLVELASLDAYADSPQDLPVDSAGTSPVDLPTGTGGTVGVDADLGTGGAAGSGGVGGTDSGGIEAGISPTECPVVNGPTNGIVSATVRTPGSTAHYSCDMGFNLTGLANRTCQVNGSWSDAAPTCSPVDCGPPPTLTGGTVEATVTTFNATAKYTCPIGTSTADALTSSCQSDGQWSAPAPTCTIVSCADLANPTEGTVTIGARTYQSTASYACLPGHTLTGDASRTCQADGKWSGAAPTCPPVNCGALSNPTAGFVSAPVATYDATATYSCTTGHALSSSATRKCQADGKWSGTAPTCEINCGQPDLPPRGGANVTTTVPQSTAYYYCKAGLQLFGNSTTTCQSDGTWSNTPPTCVCSGGTLPTNWGTDCQFTCSAGTVVTGTINCNSACWDSGSKC